MNDGAKPQRNHYSLRRQLLARLMVPLLLLFASGAVASFALAAHFANSVYDDWLYDSVNSLALDVLVTDKGIGLDFPASAQRLFEWDDADIIYYRISGARTGYITGREDLPITGENTRTLRRATLFEATLGEERLHIAALVLPAARYGEDVTVEVAETGQKRTQLAREMLLGTLLPQALLIAVAFGVLGSGIRAALSPLRLLTAQLTARDHRDLQPLSDTKMPQELRPVTQALNDLLGRLDAALKAQRKFIADAAHQLRTPLTALKLYLDQAEREAMESVTPTALQASLAQLRRASDRAIRLSNQLLALARAEPDAQPAQQFAAMDLRALALETGAEWVPQAFSKHIELSFEGEAQPTAIGNAMLIREALNNLLDNAIKYHPGNGRIALSVEEAPTRIVVDDDGLGIPAAQRPFVVQRFHRGDRSSGDGSGLGLAIAHEIMAVHGGRVELETGSSGHGLRVSLVFPA